MGCINFGTSCTTLLYCNTTSTFFFHVFSEIEFNFLSSFLSPLISILPRCGWVTHLNRDQSQSTRSKVKCYRARGEQELGLFYLVFPSANGCFSFLFLFITLLQLLKTLNFYEIISIKYIANRFLTGTIIFNNNETSAGREHYKINER